MQAYGRARGRDELIQAVFTSSEHVQRLWKTYFLRQISDEKVSPAQLIALRIIEESAPVSSHALAERLVVTAGAVTQMVDALIAAGYVERQQDQIDRRVKQLRLSPPGQALLRRIDAKRKAIFIEAFAGFSDQELSSQIVVQNKILRKLHELHDGKTIALTEEKTEEDTEGNTKQSTKEKI